MLWCQFLPFAALWGCPQSPKVPPGSVAIFDKVMVTTFVAELLAPPPPVTVTVTVGIAATPVVHAAPVHDFYPSATPGALPREYVDIPDHVNLNTPLFCHNAVVTFGDWLENGGFDLPRVTPIRLIMAAFMFGCAQMLFLIFFGDFALLTRVLNSLTRGLWMGSKVLWTVIAGLLLCLTYDQQVDSPADIVFSELLFLTQVHHDFVSKFVRRIIFARQTGGRSLVPHSPLGRAIFDFCVDVSVTTWRTLSHLLVVALTKLASLMLKISWTCLRFVGMVLAAEGYSWKSPFRLIRAICYGLYQFVVGCYVYTILFIWLHVLNPCPCKGKTPWEVNPNLATTLEQREAMQALAHMSIWDIVAVIMERDQLKRDNENLEDSIRARLMKAIGGSTKELGQRAISWRHSHVNMCTDYNHCRKTLDSVMTLLLCVIMKAERFGPHDGRFFKSSQLVLSNTPSANGLHYKPSPMFGMAEIDRFTKRRITGDLRVILCRMMAGKPTGRYMLIPSMDLYSPDSYSFDLREIGFNFPAFIPGYNPFDLTAPRPAPATPIVKQMEDYAVEGRIIEWYDDEPARLKREAERQHPFFKY